MTSTQSRKPRGTPSGGEFAGKAHAEADVALTGEAQPASGGDGTCSECGRETKRRSGLCRRHDPAAKKNRGGKAGTAPSKVAGVGKPAKKGPTLDFDAEPIGEDEIGQCEFGFVPVYRSGAKVDGAVRQCRNAVVLPAIRCHQHGGDVESSLGRTVSKARAEAGRGECYPIAAEHWDSTEERLSVAHGKLLDILETDTSRFAEAMVAWRRQQGDTPSRFSINNQMLLLVQHLENAGRDGVDEDEVWAEAVRRASEPHLSKSAWAKLGREPVDDAESVAVVWWKPASASVPDREPGESDEDYMKRVEEEERFRRGRFGAIDQIPLSQTEGEPYEVAEDPVASHVPPGFGDASAAVDHLNQHAADMGITVEFPEKRPALSVAYWKPSESKIVVWSGIGGGDDRAVAHALAHELGHAMLGHGTDAMQETRRPDAEVAAESFAALACAHHGIDSSEFSANYINGWRQAAGVEMQSAGFAPLRPAMEAFDAHVTARGEPSDIED